MTEARRYQPDAAEITTTALAEQAQGAARYSFDTSDLFEMEELKNRRLYINGEIDDTILDGIAFHIMRYNRDDEGVPVDDRRPIVLFMNTTGGGTTAGYGLIDIIETSKTPVHTVNMAECASMGFLIYIAGDVRFSMPHAQFLMHDGACAAWDSTAKVKDRVEFEMEQVEAMTKAHVLKHTSISPRLYDEKYRVEWYFLSDKGKEIGVVDAVIGRDCELSDVGAPGSAWSKAGGTPKDRPGVRLWPSEGPSLIRIDADLFETADNLSSATRAAATEYPDINYATLEREEYGPRAAIVNLEKIRRGLTLDTATMKTYVFPQDRGAFAATLAKIVFHTASHRRAAKREKESEI